LELTLRDQRLRMAWLLVVPFLFFSRPRPDLLLAGAALSAFGLLLRGWAAGCILKDQALALDGPYRFIRNPLYLGSFFLGLGAVLAGASWPFFILFVGFFVWSYSRTLRVEKDVLEERFGKAYLEYRASVPGFVPRLLPKLRNPGEGAPRSATRTPCRQGFRWQLYFRNREWQATLGAGTAFGFLAVKWALTRG
jgi:hypothetical protein